MFGTGNEKRSKTETPLTQRVTDKDYEEDQTIWVKNQIWIGKLGCEWNIKRNVQVSLLDTTEQNSLPVIKDTFSHKTAHVVGVQTEMSSITLTQFPFISSDNRFRCLN